MSEQQRTAIVTGAAGGIGRELVLGLLGNRLKVAAVDRTAQGLAELAQTVQQRQQGANLMTIEAEEVLSVIAGVSHQERGSRLETTASTAYVAREHPRAS